MRFVRAKSFSPSGFGAIFGTAMSSTPKAIYITSGAAQMAKKRKYQVELKGVPSELMAPIKVKGAHEIQRLFALAREFLKLGEPTSRSH